MSIRPIDIVTIAPKSQEASNLQTNSLRGREQVATNAEQVFVRNETKNQQRTVQASKSENKEYRYDAKEGNGRGYQGNNKKKKNNNQNDTAGKKDIKDPFSGGFDVMI